MSKDIELAVAIVQVQHDSAACMGGAATDLCDLEFDTVW
jgi:NADP-dependent 3-hydroxy acid dehydrogenase YdfG